MNSFIILNIQKKNQKNSMYTFNNIINSPPYISSKCNPVKIREKLDIIKPIYNNIKYDIDSYYMELKFIIRIIRNSCIEIELNKDSFRGLRDKIIIEELIDFGTSLLYMNKNEDVEKSDRMLQNIYDMLR